MENAPMLLKTLLSVSKALLKFSVKKKYRKKTYSK